MCNNTHFTLYGKAVYVTPLFKCYLWLFFIMSGQEVYNIKYVLYKFEVKLHKYTVRTNPNLFQYNKNFYIIRFSLYVEHKTCKVYITLSMLPFQKKN